MTNPTAVIPSESRNLSRSVGLGSIEAEPQAAMPIRFIDNRNSALLRRNTFVRGGLFMAFTCSSLPRWYGLLILCATSLCFAHFCGAQSIDETYKLALKEGGAVNVYGTLTPDTAVKVLPVFEKRFLGIKAVNTGASSDKIVARAISEARGGRTIGDVFHMNLENIIQVHDQDRKSVV